LLTDFVDFFKKWTKPQLSGTRSPNSDFSGKLIVHYGTEPNGNPCPEGRMEIFLLDQQE
jgi:hypothetical protein